MVSNHQLKTQFDELYHISDQPWSTWSKADYSIEQWHSACLIHQHDGAPTSKDQCKLPVKTPEGTLNRNGVHAAAAAYSGARGGVNASSDEMATARRALIRCYNQLDEDPPESLIKHAADDILEHFGVLGMKWGIRRDPEKADKKWAQKTLKNTKSYLKTYNEMADALNSTEIKRINNDPRFKGQNMTEDSPLRREYYAEYTRTATKLLNDAAARNYGASPSGDLRVRFRYNVGEDPMPVLQIVDRTMLRHAVMTKEGMVCDIDVDWSPTGHILKVSIPASINVQHDALSLAVDIYETDPEAAEEIIEHYGVKGMKWGVRREPEDLRDISDDDLRKSIERMRLEKQYREISASPSLLTSGRRFLAKHGDRVFGSIVGAATTFAVQRALKNHFDAPKNPVSPSRRPPIISPRALMRGRG